MLAAHLGRQDTYTFKREGRFKCLASTAVLKRDIGSREALRVLLDFKIGACILVSGRGHCCDRIYISVLCYYVIMLLYLLFIA